MAVLPREQLVQRRDAVVSAPGVILWASTTNLTTCEVQNIDEVTEGEVEAAQMAPPDFFWDVVVGPGVNVIYGDGVYGEGIYGGTENDVEDGVYQAFPFGAEDFGDGAFGGADLINHVVPHARLYWSEGAGENGVYP